MKSNGRISESKGKRKDLDTSFAVDCSPSTQRSIERGQYSSTSQYDSPSPSKRLKRAASTSVESSPTEATKQSTKRAMAAESMYKFNTPHKFFQNVIATPPSQAMSLKGKAAQMNSNHHFAAKTGPRNLPVKNLRTTPKSSPENYFAKIWAQLDASLSAIFIGEELPYSLEELYKGAENLCRQGSAPSLNKNLRHKCRDNVVENIKSELVSRSSRLQDKDLVQAFVEAWLAWEKKLKLIRNIFYYMDQSYLLRSSEKSIKEMGLALFCQHVFHSEPLRSKILQGAQELINADRRDGDGNPNCLTTKHLVGTLHDLGVYTDDFEPSFLEAAAVYLRDRAAEERSRNDLSEYLSQCTTLLNHEMDRCELYSFDRATRNQLSDLFDNIVIQERTGLLVDTNAILDLYDTNNTQALGQLYHFLDRTSQTIKLTPSFDSYINDDGSSIVFDEEKEADMVPRLLDLKRRLDYIVKNCFNGNDHLADTLHKAFEGFINRTKRTQSNWGTDNPKPGEMIAKYVDALLKGGIKAIPSLAKSDKAEPSKPDDDYDDDMVDEEVEINKQLDLALDLFRFVHGKAVFEAFYKKDLARRLLMGRSASNDAERSMLSRLKTGTYRKSSQGFCAYTSLARMWCWVHA